MVKDLKAFMEAIGKDDALRAKMEKILKESPEEEQFANCNAVAKEMGYEIEESDVADLADELDIDMDEEALNKVAGGSEVISIICGCIAVLGALGAAGTSIGYAAGSRKK